MRYETINPQLFIQNRINLFHLLPENSIAIFNSNDIMPTNADGEMGFKQNSDLFYLSGIDQEETTLVLIKKHNQTETHLFLKETSNLIKIWEGEKLSLAEAKKLSGITQVYWNAALQDFLQQQTSELKLFFYNSNEHARSSSEVQSRDERFFLTFSKNFPQLTPQKIAPLMHQLRQVKQQVEIDLMQQACHITEKGFRRILPFVRPGIFEFEIEAEITHEFLRNRSRGHAYHPIIASGANACILHYTQNNKQIKDGELILMDFGAEYANYASDLTRTIPANGRFSPRQKAVYNAVLDTLKFAKTQLYPGNTIAQYQKAVCSHIEKHLVDLKLLSLDEIKNQDPKNPAFRNYFMHGVSHSLGLDVHDVDNRERPFENNMVYTIEPGLYIPQENLGIRIENNVVINNNAPIDLMQRIPIETEEIEDLMGVVSTKY